jgi:hypothetical protein
MLERPRFLLFRRLLFPYTGEEPLTHAQGRHMITTWALFFSLALSVATVPMILVTKAVSIQELTFILLLVFLTSVVIFAAMAGFVVIMVNRCARFIQQRSQRTGTGEA